MLLSEADIVAAQSSAKISDLFLIDEQIYRSRIDGAPEPAGGWAALIREAVRTRGSIRPLPRPSRGRRHRVRAGYGSTPSLLAVFT